MRSETHAAHDSHPLMRASHELTLSALLVTAALIAPCLARAQDDLSERVQHLSDAMAQVQRQIEESQRQLKDLQQQLATIQHETGSKGSSSSSEADSGASQLALAVDELRERQSVLESQTATQDQAKVESASKYPVRFSGMILMNGYVNTGKGDSVLTPSVALGGAGTTGASLRQTILGLDMHGPHVFGASSSADIRLDFAASVSSGSTYGADKFGLARLRTAHGELRWDRTRAFFSLDKPLISPQSPDSITAVAVPALAWSGNLWTWNPQLGVEQEIGSGSHGQLSAQAALIAETDPPALFPSSPLPSYTPPSTSEWSRWPGVEAAINFAPPQPENGFLLGIGGIFAPHRVPQGKFDSWAGTLNFGLPLGSRSRFSGSAYRGQGLGGLGGGAYKDYVYRTTPTDFYFQALDDFGGWGQLKQMIGERLEMNAAAGIDNVPGHQLRPFVIPTPGGLYNLARNRTFTGNVIFSPSAYLLFSVEYRRIMSSFVNLPTQSSDVIGIAAGYKF